MSSTFKSSPCACSPERVACIKRSKPKNWILHKPPWPISFGTHHSKAMFLIYPRGFESHDQFIFFYYPLSTTFLRNFYAYIDMRGEERNRESKNGSGELPATKQSTWCRDGGTCPRQYLRNIFLIQALRGEQSNSDRRHTILASFQAEAEIVLRCNSCIHELEIEAMMMGEH
ncbi:tyrosyl-DNA phosphodiesterase [Trifolium repens]|nr:tyrosyl-DNA phosphodiesterase [Trifolium repens]